MIGKAKWFERRKYGGWGLKPKTWQGWVYIAVFGIPFAVFQSLPYWDTNMRLIVTGVWLGILFIDVIDIMAHLKKDEREKTHEAFAERNAAWAMVAVLTVGILYQVFISTMEQTFKVDIFLIVTLFAGLIAKSATNIYLDHKN